MVMYETNKKGMKKALWDDLMKTSRENPESMFDGTVEKEVKVTNVFLRIMQFELEDIHDIYNKEEPGRDEFDVFADIFGLTADAKHSVFKDNINRVKQANADVLKELDIN